MKYQVNKELHPDIRKWGCYFLSILRIYEIVSKKDLSVNEVNNIYKVGKRAGFLGEEAYVNAKGISGIASVASGLTGKHVYIKRTDSNSVYNFLISKHVRTTNSGKLVSHFVLVDMDDPLKIIYDPWSSAGSKTGREGKSHSYRYIFGEMV